MKVNQTIIVIKRAEPSEDDLAVANKVGFGKYKFVFGGNHFKCIPSEKFFCEGLINLTDREDINEFYKDVLVDVSSLGVKEQPKAEEKVKEEEVEEKTKEEPAATKPRTTTRKPRTTKKEA